MEKQAQEKQTMGFWSIFSIGVGGMVGGGIFAVLGLAVVLTQGAIPIAFFLAGLVALITSYSYAKLSIKYPCQGGTVEFLNQAFGTGYATGGLNVLLWISYIVMISLYASAFGSYGASLLPAGAQALWKHLLISGVIILFTILNVIGTALVGKAERWIVGFKLAILLSFIGLGLWTVNPQNLASTTWASPLQIAAGGMVIFLAYEGFELIANTAQDVKEPKKNLPRAYYSSVIFVIILYVLISIVAVGNLSVTGIVGAEEYALAESARPFLGAFGFTLVAITALLSTASAINATLYGAARVTYVNAKNGELPGFFDKKIWNNAGEGLLVTTVIALVLANAFDISTISVMGSAGFLLIFIAVNWANVRLHRKTGSKKWISILGMAACSGALAALLWQRIAASPNELWVLVIMVGSAYAIEVVYRKASGRTFKTFFRRNY